MSDANKYQAQANELSQKLWAIANDLRGQMDASEFKNYILGIIFYRYLSERTEMYMENLLKDDGMKYEEAFGPLCSFRSYAANTQDWQWKDNPWPWQKDANFSLAGKECK